MNIPLIAGLAILAGLILERIVLYFVLNMLRETGMVGKNYQGDTIPLSTGITFPVAIMPVFLIYELFSCYDSSYSLFLLGIVFISFLGFIDDSLGRRDTLGFRGHFSALFRGKLTTGGLKAVGGGFIAFFLAFFVSDGWLNIILNTLIIAFAANMLNLLDLRPGRAIKGFFFCLLIVVALAVFAVDPLLIAPLLGIVLAYLPEDLQAKTMMGDAGSNVLGLALGFLCIMSLSLLPRIGILIFLIAVHIYTERFSLSRTIENNAVLKAIDQWGRNEFRRL